MYQITKRGKDGEVFIVIEESDEALAGHISACFKFTDYEILAVLKIIKNT